MPPAQSVQGAFLVNVHVSKARNSLSCTGALSLFDVPVFDLLLCVSILFINFAPLDQREIV